MSEDLVDRAHAEVDTNMMLLLDVKERDGVKLMPEQEQKLKAGPATRQDRN